MSSVLSLCELGLSLVGGCCLLQVVILCDCLIASGVSVSLSCFRNCVELYFFSQWCLSHTVLQSVVSQSSCLASITVLSHVPLHGVSVRLSCFHNCVEPHFSQPTVALPPSLFIVLIVVFFSIPRCNYTGAFLWSVQWFTTISLSNCEFLLKCIFVCVCVILYM